MFSISPCAFTTSFTHRLYTSDSFSFKMHLLMKTLCRAWGGQLGNLSALPSLRHNAGGASAGQTELAWKRKEHVGGEKLPGAKFDLNPRAPSWLRRRWVARKHQLKPVSLRRRKSKGVTRSLPTSNQQVITAVLGCAHRPGACSGIPMRSP